MKKAHVRIAILFSVLGFLGLLLNIFYFLSAPGSIDPRDWAINIVSLFVLTFCSLLSASPRFYGFRIFHPIIVGVMTIIACIQDPTHYISFCGFILCVALLYTYGYMAKHFVQKGLALVAGYSVILIVSVAIREKGIRDILSPLFFFFGFGLILVILFSEQIHKKTLPALDLGAYELSEIDRAIVRLVAKGRDPKGIAADLDLPPGTVYKHLSRLYPKFETKNIIELTRFLADYRVE